MRYKKVVGIKVPDVKLFRLAFLLVIIALAALDISMIVACFFR